MKTKLFIFTLISIVFWRVFLLIPLWYGEKTIPYNTSEDYTRVWGFTTPYSPVSSIFLYPFANFDGVHYLSIAAKGYENNGRFMPLYPYGIGIISRIFHAEKAYDMTYFFTAFLLTHLIFFASLYMLYRLVRLDYKSSIAVQTIFFLLFFPTSFFLVSIYTEGLFLLLSTASFYLLRKKQFYYAACTAFFLSLTRIVGIVLFPIVLYAFIEEKKLIPKIRKNMVKSKDILSLIPLFLIPSGLLGYAWFCYVKWGNALYFLTAHTEIGNNRSSSIVLFPQTIFRYIKILLALSPHQMEWSVALLELAAFMFSICMLVIGWKKRIPKEYLLFSLFCLLIPASSGTFSGLPRYILPLFPLFLAVTLIENKLLKLLYCVLGSILLFFCFMYFSKGYYIA